MVRGIFTAASSMMARQTEQEIIANNLANLNTAGYKKDRILFRNTLDAQTLINKDPQVTPADDIKTDFSQGRLYKTDNLYDFALENDGFFVIAGNNGNFYTRNGHFIISENGELLTPTGLPVLGESGPITLPDGNFTVNQQGEILANNTVIDKFLIARFNQPAEILQKAGNNLFTRAANAPEPDFVEPRIRQGFLEGSNVNIIEEMVNMIMAFRDFANNQKTIATQDETLQRAVRDLGSV